MSDMKTYEQDEILAFGMLMLKSQHWILLGFSRKESGYEAATDSSWEYFGRQWAMGRIHAVWFKAWDGTILVFDEVNGVRPGKNPEITPYE